MQKMFFSLVLIALTAAVLSSARDEAGPAEAEAVIYDANRKACGTVKFHESDQGVRISIELHGLPPGEHGFHIHEYGRCDPPDFTTAGGHFNPGANEHGFLNPAGPHAGDLPNIRIGPDSSLTTSFTSGRLSLKREAANSLLRTGGTSVVIHRDPDDYLTDPAGHAGQRIACGVIGGVAAAGDEP